MSQSLDPNYRVSQRYEYDFPEGVNRNIYVRLIYVRLTIDSLTQQRRVERVGQTGRPPCVFQEFKVKSIATVF